MKYVVIGSSAAGVNGVREIRKRDKDGEIILISADRNIYSRCILHQYLSGIRNEEKLCFVEKNFAELYQVNWMKGCTAESLDPKARELRVKRIDLTARKVDREAAAAAPVETVTYDKLLIATGSHTFFPPFIKNLEGAKNAIGFRNISDIEELKTVAKTRKNIIVLGAGLVGLDCASGFLDMGVKVTMVEFAPWMLSKQLDERAAKTYQDAFAKRGVIQYFGVGLNEVTQNDDHEITEAILSDGTRLPCDYLVVTAGVRSNVEFLADSGIELSKFGLVFDEYGRTSDPDVYGAGDVSGLAPIWPIAVKEGIVAGANMTGHAVRMDDFFASKSTMNFLGITSMSLGDINAKVEGAETEIQEKGEIYRKIIHKDGKILAALLQNDLSYSGTLQQLIARKIDVRKVKKPIFDIDYSDFFHTKENFEFYYE